jgi:hypothetical protein
MIVGVIRVHLDDALKWLGDGGLLSTHALFPPPSYDSGYKEILKHIDLSDPVLGSIRHIGA